MRCTLQEGRRNGLLPAWLDHHRLRTPQPINLKKEHRSGNTNQHGEPLQKGTLRDEITPFRPYSPGNHI